MGDLYEIYSPYIDWEIYEGLSDEEVEELQEKNFKKYGLNHILRADAPLEAVKAWREDAKRTKAARKEGKILN